MARVSEEVKGRRWQGLARGCVVWQCWEARSQAGSGFWGRRWHLEIAPLLRLAECHLSKQDLGWELSPGAGAEPAEHCPWVRVRNRLGAVPGRGC